MLGLEFGADDYITKPFDMREVVARVKNVFRRRGLSGPNQDKDRIQVQDVLILKNEHKVIKSGQTADLTPKEYDLLLTLCENRGLVFSRNQLLNMIWGYEFLGDTRTVDMHIQRIRKKLELEKQITTVFGVGYRMENQE